MLTVRFAVILIASFVAMEFFSYLAHRYVYHGIGWILHKSHHEPRTGTFERNDLFPGLLAVLTTTVMMVALGSGQTDLLAASIGVTAYGLLYFVVHDLYVHRRMKRFPLQLRFLARVKKAHAVHHRFGGEPYGLLFFSDPKVLAAMEREKGDLS
jgi:beta-carotene 3-hydroxylase